MREALQLRLDAGQSAGTRTASVLASLGRVLHARGRLDEAEEVLNEALAIRRRLLGDEHLHTALTEKDLASVYFDLGEDAVAEVLWSRADGERPGPDTAVGLVYNTNGTRRVRPPRLVGDAMRR